MKYILVKKKECNVYLFHLAFLIEKFVIRQKWVPLLQTLRTLNKINVNKDDVQRKLLISIKGYAFLPLIKSHSNLSFILFYFIYSGAPSRAKRAWDRAPYS